MNKRILITVIGVFIVLLSHAQEFKAKFIVGAAASQIDGDLYGGYNQLGGVLGFATSFPLSEKMAFQQEIVYYGRGSRKSVNQAGEAFTFIGMHYVDLDAVLNYYATEELIVSGGLGYGNLIYERSDAAFEDVFRPDIFLFLGVGYLVKDNIELNVRWQNSVRSIHKFIFPFHSNTLNFTARFILGGE